MPKAAAFLISATSMWVVAAIVEHWFMSQPEIFAWLFFGYVVLPFMIAPATGVLAALLVGPPRSLFASVFGAVVGCIVGLIIMHAVMSRSSYYDVSECLRDMAIPALSTALAAVWAAALAQRRVA